MEIEEVEAQAVGEATGALAEALVEIQRWAVSFWIARYGSITAHTPTIDTDSIGALREFTAFLLDLRTRLGAVMSPVPTKAARAISAAAMSTYAEAADESVKLSGQKLTLANYEINRETIRKMLNKENVLRRAKVRNMLSPANVRTVGFDAVLSAVQEARKVQSDVRRSASVAITKAHSAAVEHVAKETDSYRLWEGERDACLHCTAYMGLFVRGNKAFPVGLTFAANGKAVRWRGFSGFPPLHPECRCKERLVPATDGPSEVEDRAAALQREAKRSVLKGWALESESSTARADAARKLLLDKNLTLPKTVQAEARRKLKQGKKFRSGVPRTVAA